MRAHTAARDCAMVHNVGGKVCLDLNSDLNVATASGNASSWGDAAGSNASITQATIGQRPAYVAGVLDGHAALRFDGVDDCMDCTVGIPGMPVGSLPWVYCVWTPRSGSTTYIANVYSFGNGGSTQVHNHTLFHFNDGGLYANVDGISTAAYTDSNLTARLTTAKLTPTAILLDLNNAQKSTAPPAAVGVQNQEIQIRVGKRWDNAFPANIDLFRLIAINNPTPGQHQSVLAMLRAQYPSVPIA